MDDNDIAIKVSGVGKTFKLPHEKTSSIKSLLINFRKRRTYERQEALKNISFDVKKGEFFGIVGRNGSGKSTLLKLMAGIYTPTKGDIAVQGQITPFIELGVGFSPELTGKENVFLNGSLLGFNRKQMQAMYQEIVDFAELERFMDQKLKNYSSGMQVRLAFSIAIRAKGDILLLDEVLAVGDAAFQQKCYDYFEELKEQKKTVVFVTHDMAAVSRFCSKAVYIKDGKLIKNGSPDEIAEMYKIENLESAEQRQMNSGVAGPKLSDSHSLSATLLEETNKVLKVKFAYKSSNKEPLYIGISVIRDGISIAELTTSHKSPLIGNGQIEFSLDKELFNVGVYQITSILCRLDGRKLLTIGQPVINFSISGKKDIQRGAALKLEDTWEPVKT